MREDEMPRNAASTNATQLLHDEPGLSDDDDNNATPIKCWKYKHPSMIVVTHPTVGGLEGVPSRPIPVDVDSSPGVGLKDDNITPKMEEVEFEVSFVEGKIGLSLEVIHPNVVRVKDTSGPARACNVIEIGDVLVRVQGIDIAAHRFTHVMHTLKSAPRPLTVRFRRPVRTVELPPHFQLDRDLDQPFEYRYRGGPQDADSVRACHEESDDDSTVDTVQDDSASSNVPWSSTSSKCHTHLLLPRFSIDDSKPDHKLSPSKQHDGEPGGQVPAPSILAAQWKAITDWSFGLTKPPPPLPPPTSWTPPLDDFETAMLSLRIEPPAASLLPTSNTPSSSNEDGARLLLRWQPCVGAETYHLQQSRDWPVKVWKQCNVTTAAAVVNKTLSDGSEDDVANTRTLREGIVQGLDFNKSYVFRIRCGLHSGAWGDFSDASDPVTTPLPTITSIHYPGAATLGRTTAAAAPTDVTLGYHADFEGDANAMSLVVTWTSVLDATTFQVQWMRHGQRLVWRNSPELSAWEVGTTRGPQADNRADLAASCPATSSMQYTLQGLASGTEYVVRVKAARDGPDGRTWGDFSEWSAPLATIASEDDLQDAKDALARKEAALAVVAHLKDMANSVKGLYQASVK